MNKKLGALALLGASAVVLAGCAGGSSGGTDASGTPAAAQLRVWLVGTDTPQDARDYLKKTFEADNPGSTLVIEEQQWTGLVDKLTTSLSSNDTPDIVEMGNTQAAAFTSSGALLDISDIKDQIGGDDLLPGFVEAGSWDGKLYAAPYYSGARIVFYNTTQYATAGVQVPTTLDEYVAGGEKLAQALPGVSGVYFPGKDWYNALPFIWENGGEVAVQKDGKWEAQMSSDASVKGIEQVQQLMTKASLAPKDGDETEAWVPFRTEKAATLSAPSWAYWSIVADEDKAETALSKTVGYYALPGKDGGAAKVFAGGSNIGIAAKSANPELAKSALEIMLSDEYQSILAKAGLVPAKKSLGGEVAAATPELAKIIADAAANAKLTPASPKWADVEAKGLLQDFFVQVAAGGDVKTLATALDEQIDAILNG
ncbi:extracellular solute-binding protein [Microbacterium hominis]|uniref:Sugar transporter n=1 Tax=Microbacterium hominis TaxID=162426 RepID=A0A134DEE5_9MICO|nr:MULTISPECIES: extracellular solute-binding protein [Microbacterium]AUG30548.1 sugar transporter [Microbacterium hominis]KXC04881.1 sugar transporter [Microbacterium hominis]QOC26310.1 extracellular solute-binding protein [Microbacterium hominis]QOC30255.1 extracellular solute-binding protein [Microbacterium hominis]QRY41831.1 extracellular solute-binding protein [Microbacterium hominis]